jgi:4-amino-4-deoxy-L-arabinose transferase-like glycosyltransferase
VLLALHGWLAYTATANKSATFDEPLHMVGGYAYTTESDFRLHPENGVLPQRRAGLALRAIDPALPIEGFAEAWRTSDIAALSAGFLYDVGNDHRAMLAAARRAAVLWSIALGLVVFAWAYTLWGATPALLSLALFSFSPTMLAHGPLVTSDVAAALALLLAAWAWWRHLERLSLSSLLLSAATAGVAAIAKFSAAILPPLFVVMALCQLWLQPVWTLHIRRPRELRGLVPRAAWIAAAALLHAVVAACIIWAAFDFRYAAAGPGTPEMAQFYRLWSDVLPPDGALRSVLSAMRDGQLLPEAYIYGFSFVLRYAESRAAFLNGEFGLSGWWWFFPYAFVVKSTLAELLVTLSAVVVGVAAWRRRARPLREWLNTDARPLLPLLLLTFVYTAMSVTSHLNIGHRHLLPLYPVLFVAAGGLAVAGGARWRRVVAVAALALGVIESVAVRPHYLAFFNASVGGPSQGWRHLVDSSLDWGQDAPLLVDWLRVERREGEALYFNIFGQRRAAALGIFGTEIAPSYVEQPRPWVEWGPGLYAVSATMLQDVYSPFAGRWDAQKENNFQILSRGAREQRLKDPASAVIPVTSELGSNYRTLERLQFSRLMNYLRLRQPDAVLGYTVFVHRLSAAEAQVITSGDTPSYLAMLEALP